MDTIASSPSLPRLLSPASLHHSQDLLPVDLGWNTESPKPGSNGSDVHASSIKEVFERMENDIKASRSGSVGQQKDTKEIINESIIIDPDTNISGAPSGSVMSPIVGLPPRPQAPPGRQGSGLPDPSQSSLLRTKTSSGSQNLFNEVLDQLTSHEESLPRQASLYTLPSMTFLESLLDEMDSRNASQGVSLQEPPIYLPVESFDLPGLDGPGNSIGSLEELGLAPPPTHQRTLSCPVQYVQSSKISDMCGFGDARLAMPPPSPFSVMTIAPTAGSAAPSPQKQTNQQRQKQKNIYNKEVHGIGGLDEESMEELLFASMRATQHCGAKRKIGDAVTMISAPAEYCRSKTTFSGVSAIDTSSELGYAEASGGSKKSIKVRKQSKATICLNCGSCETPQWRCGPLGPRTLCNACGVRYKKGLPLSCWPLRNGMVLPPGAELPPSVVVPEGITIVTQPAKPRSL